MTTGCGIPPDLTIEILLKLPAKSVLRFKSVSKSWRSIISSRQFINSFMSRSRLILGFKYYDGDGVSFFSIPHQSCSFSEESPMLVAEKNTLKMPKPKSYTEYLGISVEQVCNSVKFVCNSVQGFLCCSTRDGFVVCNPTTRQVISLAGDKYDLTDYFCRMFLGYDPNNNQYKVLRIIGPKHPPRRLEHSVCTLGGQGSSRSWRSIETSTLYNFCYQSGVCVDGVVYYEYTNIQNHRKIGGFDVGSEQLHLIETPEDLKGYLTNYLGKLAVYINNNENENGLSLWVLDDVKNQLWSKKTYVVPFFTNSFDVCGEIVYGGQPFEILCYDAEKKIERKVRVDNIHTSNISPFYLCSSYSYVENIIYL